MSTDKIKDIEERIAGLKAQLEKLEAELEKVKEHEKRSRYQCRQ
jgi:uncharacterized small protein (DUF1192 family)